MTELQRIEQELAEIKGMLAKLLNPQAVPESDIRLVTGTSLQVRRQQAKERRLKRQG